MHQLRVQNDLTLSVLKKTVEADVQQGTDLVKLMEQSCLLYTSDADDE